jgi:hypothetical protein
MGKSDVIRVYLEAGSTRVFASALDWPGWSRRAKTDEEALDALASYAPRYAVVAKRAGVPFAVAASPTFEVVERIPARAKGTFSHVDFGALGEPAAADADPLSAAEAKRQTALLKAAWAVLDAVVAEAPEELRKGPRGGGRDRDAVAAHVVAAETAYARKLGVRHRAPASADAIAALRADITQTLMQLRVGEPAIANGWLPRYAARRIAWHALDHAWEIEDRSAT